MKHGLLRLAFFLCIWIAGTSQAGVPLSPPTRQQTLALLATEDFTHLNESFSAVQAAYRDGAIDDQELRAAFRAFYVTDPALEVRFNAWVKRYPQVYVAHLARGIYFKYVGSERRGGDFIARTGEEQLRGMREADKEASISLHRSFELDKKPILSYLHAIDLSMRAGDSAESRRLLDLAIHVDSRNFIVREKYMSSLFSRWGGSLQQVVEFYEDCKRAGLSPGHLGTLEALVAEERAWTATFRDRDYRAAARARVEARKLGRGSGCLSCFVSEATRDGKYDQAISALNAVLNENPRDVEALQLRSATYRRTGKTKEWIEDLKAAAALGDAYSQLNLGVYYMTGIPGVLAADRNAGKALFRQVLKQSDAEPEYAKEAQHNLETAKYQDAHPTQPIPVVEQSSPGS